MLTSKIPKTTAMNLKRAIGISLLTYISTFIVGMVAALIMGLDLTSTDAPPPEMFYISAVAAVVIAALFSVWYFKGKGIEKNAKQGLFFGITLIIIGFIMDIITFIPYVLGGGSYNDLFSYYANPVFLVTLVLILGTPAAIGHFLSKK